MATDFLVELILSGHDVFLLEDEETIGRGLGNGRGDGTGCGDGSGVSNGDDYFTASSGRGNSFGDGLSTGYGDGGGSSGSYRVKRKEEYGYRLPG